MAAQRKCSGLVIVPPDYGLYVKFSRAFMKLLNEYSDNVIQYSIDEAWVVFEGFEKLYGRDRMVKLVYEIKDRIRSAGNLERMPFSAPVFWKETYPI